MSQTYTENNKGVDVSEADQIEYNSWFADLCHFHGLAVGLKNAIELAPVLVNKFDFAINEECFKWNECDVSVLPPQIQIFCWLMVVLCHVTFQVSPLLVTLILQRGGNVTT